jgi:uncharacterized membrane protein YhiD involved in acid resistance
MMKSVLVYGIAATFMVCAVMAGEKRVSRSVSASDKSGTHVVASTNATAKAFASATTNATAKASSHSSSSDSKKSEQTKRVKNQQAVRN